MSPRCRAGSATASRSSSGSSTSTPARRGRSRTRCARSYDDYLRDWDERGSPWEYWVEQTERARAAFAGLVNAAPDEVAVTTSLSEGVSSIASGLRYAGKRSKVVLSDYEFPTVGQIFHAQESRGARVVHVPPAADGTIPLEGFDRAIDDETLLVAITHISYRTGAMLDVERIARMAHERGALVLLDSYQAAGSVPIDVKALDVRRARRRRAQVPARLGRARVPLLPARAGRAVLAHVDRLVRRPQHLRDGPSATTRRRTTAARFQSGTPPVPAIYAGVAGIELMQEIGVAETREHVLGLNRRLIEGLDELRARVVTPRRPKQRGALVCVKSYDAPALVEALRRVGIVTSSRDSNLRISAHCYNAVEDVDAVLDALTANRRLLA